MALTYPLITISSRLQVQKDKKGKDAYKVTDVERWVKLAMGTS